VKWVLRVLKKDRYVPSFLGAIIGITVTGMSFRVDFKKSKNFFQINASKKLNIFRASSLFCQTKACILEDFFLGDFVTDEILIFSKSKSHPAPVFSMQRPEWKLRFLPPPLAHSGASCSLKQFTYKGNGLTEVYFLF
jgi:hypothetical protein